MKFDLHDYWMHENGMNVFFCVHTVRFDDDGRNAILTGTWCNQCVSCWFIICSDRIKITPEHYSKWKRHTPVGKLKL